MLKVFISVLLFSELTFRVLGCWVSKGDIGADAKAKLPYTVLGAGGLSAVRWGAVFVFRAV